jgi:hypothetical protein
LRTILAATSTLKEITETIAASGQVQEKWFDIELPDACSMRKDTKLVVDIPGVTRRQHVHEAREGEVGYV